MQNYILLFSFLPDKTGDRWRDARENKQEHIARYSDKQVYIGHSVLCVICSLLVYGLNYRFQLLPGHTVIWIVVLSFPFIAQLASWLTGKRTTLQDDWDAGK